MSELLRGALLVKLNVWEHQFMKRISSIRASEVVHMRASETLNSATLAIFQAAPILATLVIFAVYTVGLNKALSPSTAFAVVAWINVSNCCRFFSL